MAKKMKAECGCMHHTWMGWKMFILGLLILANAYWPVIGWAKFVGIIISLMGLVLLLKPNCKCR